MMLPSFHRVIIQGRNEDLAIVTVTNLPPGEIPFGLLHKGILDFLGQDLGLEIKEVQRCPFGRGQAYVRMGCPSDRDALIAHSPHFRNGLSFSFVQHNWAVNARRVGFNRECWLMLIGFPPDSRSAAEIEDSIRSFGRLILWQKDNVLARVILKARVTDLIDIPHYLILSEGDDFEGISYTAHNFSPVGCPDQVIHIPTNWAAFFIAMLLSPEHFDWAKKFLASKAWEFMLSCTSKSAMMAFAIPSSCPSSSLVLCISQSEEVCTSPCKGDSSVDPKIDEQSTPRKPGVRRSDRIKARSGGFRRASCHDKNCLACNATPPTIPTANIQSLGDKVCGINPLKTSLELLSAKAGPQKNIGIRKERTQSALRARGCLSSLKVLQAALQVH
uniref:DUF7597 domain-containing protein n=1 Tax=Setaria viridis TaxID=4556 RepID=A0A4U6VM94_SETVI|nr:hypothetical protein SEVIR_3G350900v2 [Setaria viridis]